MIKAEQYSRFLKSVTNELEGDWLVIGGSLLAIVQSDSRATVDIDLCPIDEMTNDLRINLMRVAELSGLSIESINPAADYFLKQIPNWKSAIILHITGQKGRLFRPSFELYLKLKIERLSQTDFDDCLLYFKWNMNVKNSVNKSEIQNILDSKLVSEKNSEKIELLKRLKLELAS